MNGGLTRTGNADSLSAVHSARSTNEHTARRSKLKVRYPVVSVFILQNDWRTGCPRSVYLP